MTHRDFLIEVAREVQNSLFLKPDRVDRKIFLGGAAPGTPDGLRDDIATGLERRGARSLRWVDQYDIYYPETLFDGLTSGPDHYDLLTLENLLAEAVDAVVLVIESPGTMTELGAFANHEVLRKKLVAVLSKRYERRKSFIRRGPLRLLEDLREGAVVYVDYKNIRQEIPAIHTAIARVTRANRVPLDLSNPLQAHKFVAPCLYVLDHATREEITLLVKSAIQETFQSRADIVANTALTLLLRDGHVAAIGEHFELTAQGLRDFRNESGWRRRTPRYSWQTLDRIRVRLLTRERRRYPRSLDVGA